jgi:hypothetical protein
MPKFQVYKDAAGKFRFRLIAGNNQIVAVGEAYEKHAGCINGIRSIQKNCGAEIEDLILKNKKVPNPKYQIYKDSAGKFRFRLKASNGEIIAEGEGYESKEGCLNGINVVRSSCDAEIEDLTIAKKANEENVVSIKTEETSSSSETAPKVVSASEKVNEVESTPRIEASEVSSSTITTPKTEPVLPPPKTEAVLPAPKTESALPESKTEETPQTAPISVAEMGVSTSSGPIETTLELYPMSDNITKGNDVSFQGMLSETSSGKGIAGAEIRIYETKSIFGDDWLAVGRTNQDGTFKISWKAMSITWGKNAVNTYAKFLGNEKAKSSKSVLKPLKVN